MKRQHYDYSPAELERLTGLSDPEDAAALLEIASAQHHQDPDPDDGQDIIAWDWEEAGQKLLRQRRDPRLDVVVDAIEANMGNLTAAEIDLELALEAMAQDRLRQTLEGGNVPQLGGLGALAAESFPGVLGALSEQFGVAPCRDRRKVKEVLKWLRSELEVHPKANRKAGSRTIADRTHVLAQVVLMLTLQDSARGFCPGTTTDSRPTSLAESAGAVKPHLAQRLQATALTVAAAVRIEIALWRLKRVAPQRFKELTRGADGIRAQGTRAIEFANKILDEDIAPNFPGVVPDWRTTLRLRLGLSLVGIILDHAHVGPPSNEIPAIVHLSDGRRSQWLSLSMPAGELVRRIDGETIAEARQFGPMLVPPKPWTAHDPFSGGFLIPRLGIVPDKDIRTFRSIIHDGYPLVAHALNRLGAVPWIVNRRVLDVAKHFQDEGFPSEVDNALPVGKSRAARTKRRNTRNALIMAESYAIAQEKYPGTYHYVPWRCDKRGRMYAMSGRLHVQLQSLEKALLLFGEPKRFGRYGLSWFLLWGAKTLGYDKLSPQERLDIMRSREVGARILRVAEDPVANLADWADADDPWLFLAYAYEHARLLEHIEAGHSAPDFESALPTYLDATCSVVQHYASAMRSETDAESVNLKRNPAGIPRDLYLSVAAKWAQRLETLASGDVVATEETQAMAQAWLAVLARAGMGRVRKLAKSCVMPALYSSPPFGTAQRFLGENGGASLESAVLKPSEIRYLREEADSVGSTLFLFVLRGVEELHRASQEAVPDSHIGRNFVRDCAKIIANFGHDLEYRTPANWPVKIRARKDSPGRRYQADTFTVSAGRISVKMARKKTGAVDVNKVFNSAAPNFVHGLDASHLVLLLEALPEDIHLAALHDAVVVRAGDADDVHSGLREVMYEMHGAGEGGVLQDFRDQLAERFPVAADVLPPVPKLGEFDLDDIRDAGNIFG